MPQRLDLPPRPQVSVSLGGRGELVGVQEDRAGADAHGGKLAPFRAYQQVRSPSTSPASPVERA